jgi:outer membrane murein-binding lipoprotein Lpp
MVYIRKPKEMEEKIMVKKKILTSVYVSAVLLVAGCGNKNNINNTVKETSSEIYTVSDVNKTDSYVYASVTSVQKQSENSSENNESADMGSGTSVIDDSPSGTVQPVTYADTSQPAVQNIQNLQNNMTDNSGNTDITPDYVPDSTSDEPVQEPEQPATSKSRSYIVNTYGSYEAYGKEVINEINKLRASYGYEPLVENARADEIAYKVNCEQSSASIGHWTGEQRPSLSGLYRNLDWCCRRFIMGRLCGSFRSCL